MIFPSSVNLAPLLFALPSSAHVPTKRLEAVEVDDPLLDDVPDVELERVRK